ncbi:PaaI family thioesterase [Nocardioides limicola]|uniref:PaaI family thioesterase n=1 Tax=Nocardioides limicola TaxID=2803368 RepID=UPI00193B900B|nr:PaaI family thioesterase [Nocardioides sp. DJM-14]
MPGFELTDIPTAEIDRAEAEIQPLVDTLREVVDATIRTCVGADQLQLAQQELESALARLQADQFDGPAGVKFNSEGRSWNWGNTVVGQRNAMAPPLRITHVRPGLAHAKADLGAVYEGPPGLVHGGVTALLLDHLMGETASAGHTRVTLTGTLSLRYVKGARLGPVRLDAHIDREDGRKVYVLARLSDAEGVCTEADGVFIVPRWFAESQ